MAAAEAFIYLGSDTYLLLGKTLQLHDTAIPGTPIAGATVTADLFDQKSGDLIIADVACDDVAGTPGFYRGNIDNDLAGLEEHQRVVVFYTADDGPGRTLKKMLIATVVIAT